MSVENEFTRHARESRERVGWPGAGNEIREDRDVSGSAVSVFMYFWAYFGVFEGRTLGVGCETVCAEKVSRLRRGRAGLTTVEDRAGSVVSVQLYLR